MSTKNINNRTNNPSEIDRNTTLCLACSCSLPPFRKGIASPTGDTSTRPSAEAYLQFLAQQGVFVTSCCNQPICSACVRANPRLTRYNPCLSCLAGVDAVSPRRANALNSAGLDGKNVNGAVRDEDTYIVGDDDEDEDDEDLPPAYGDADSELVRNPWASTSSIPNVRPQTQISSPPAMSSTPEPPQPHQQLVPTGPSKYFLNKRDTLQGLALRFGVDGRELCRLNKLPISTFNTTPHLLHTRSYIILPLSVPSQPQDDEEVKAREAKRAREKAERKLQTLMKETDPSIAKAYVALIDDEEAQEAMRMKRKEMQGGPSPVVNGSSLEAAAIEHIWRTRTGKSTSAGKDVAPALLAIRQRYK